LRRLSTDEALRRANQTLSQIIAACPHAIVAVDRDRNVRIWNPAAERIFGWSSKEVLGGRVPFVSESQRKHSDLFNQRALGGEVIQNLELQRTRRDGKRLDLLVSAAPTYDDLGAVDGFLTVATDVTQNKQLEQQLLRGQRLESLGSMASGIAHDLNNVLSPIRTALQLFRVNSADPMMQHTVDTLESCVKRGADLIRQVLTFARGVQGERILLETRQAVQETERVVLQTLPKTITVMTDVQEDLWCVLADLTQFHQVLMNLCINARDAMPNGGKLTVIARNVVLDHARQLVSIEVRDTGCGIAAETRDKIFEPFFTTKAPGQGTGLGLSTVAAIVRNHGGFVEVESRVGEGTSFKVYFPAIPGKEARRTLKSRNVMPVGNGELVLLVDDEAAVRDIARLTLEMHGYRVLEARDGAEGVALYAQHRNEVSVVISDMDMPVMTGSSMIQSLEWINPQVRIISASGLVGESQANDHNASSPVRVILPKPYTAEELLRTVHDVIRVA
jgi:PAS domain S-box-containing protein